MITPEDALFLLTETKTVFLYLYAFNDVRTQYSGHRLNQNDAVIVLSCFSNKRRYASGGLLIKVLTRFGCHVVFEHDLFGSLNEDDMRRLTKLLQNTQSA